MAKCAACDNEAVGGDVYCEECLSTKERSRTSLKVEVQTNEKRERKKRLRAARISDLLDPVIWAGKIMVAFVMAIIISGIISLFGSLEEYFRSTPQMLLGTPDSTVIVTIGVGTFTIVFIGLTILGLYDPHGWGG